MMCLYKSIPMAVENMIESELAIVYLLHFIRPPFVSSSCTQPGNYEELVRLSDPREFIAQ